MAAEDGKMAIDLPQGQHDQAGVSAPEQGAPDADTAAAIVGANALLRARFAPDAEVLRPLYGGLTSRAFAFAAGGHEYVLRLSPIPESAGNFEKDAYAARHFAGPTLPIPAIVASGAVAAGEAGLATEEQFAISALVPGTTLADADPAARRRALPALLDTIDAVGRVDVGGSRGFGPWDETGDASYDSWTAFLAAADQNDTRGYYWDWHALFGGMLERELYDAVYRHMCQLPSQLPEQRGLIHNDLWFPNVLAADVRITGVIDWGNALYGDPLYDVARLSWGADWPGWWYKDGRALLAARFGASPGFAMRLACYQCHLGLDDLRFYAKNGKAREYGWASERLRGLLVAPIAS